jgi:hypothetical protein
MVPEGRFGEEHNPSALTHRQEQVVADDRLQNIGNASYLSNGQVN